MWYRLPFGTKVSSEVFQKHLLEALFGLSGIIWVADDIAIYGKTSEEHDENLRKFFERCLETCIKINNNKKQAGRRTEIGVIHRSPNHEGRVTREPS